MGWCTAGLEWWCLLVVCIVQGPDLGSRFHQSHAAKSFLGSVVGTDSEAADPACCTPEVDCTETHPVEAVATLHNSAGCPEILESAGSVHQRVGSVVLADSAVAGGSAGTPNIVGAAGPCTVGMDCHRHWSSCLQNTALLHPPNRTLPGFSRTKGVYVYWDLVVGSYIGILQVEFFDRISLIPKRRSPIPLFGVAHSLDEQG